MSFSGNQKTRLGLIGIMRSLYGSFAGKTLNTAAPNPISASQSVLTDISAASNIITSTHGAQRAMTSIAAAQATLQAGPVVTTV